MEQKRIAWADRVRVLAIFAVIMIHTASPLFNTLPVNTAGFFFSLLFDAVSHVAIPLLVMVSGMFLLDEKRDVSIRRAVEHYALPMVGMYVFWSFIYALANKVVQPMVFENASFGGTMVKEFGLAFLEGAYHLWYLPMLVGLYLLTPLLRTFVKEEKMSLVRWFLVLAVTFQFALPALIRLMEIATGYSFASAYDSFYLSLFIGYPAYYVAGWYIAHYRPAKRWPVYIAGAVGFLLMVGLTAVESLSAGEGVKEWMEPLSLFCGWYGVAVFATFAWSGKANSPTASSSRLLAKLSSLSFGVYIVHVEVQSLFKAFFPYTSHPVAYMLIQFVAVSLISLTASWILSKIPLLKRAVRG